MRFYLKQFLSAILVLGFLSCGEDDFKKEVKPKAPELKTNSSTKYSTEEGVLGVFDVEPMLCFSISDSAEISEVAVKVATNYRFLEDELKNTGTEKGGPPGQIIYNNDPKNFKFQCLQPIKKAPIIMPEKADVVEVKGGKMLVYNYYGPYEKLYTAYAFIRDFCKMTQMQQTGPMREFYVNDPNKEPDSSKYLTRIFLPVKKVDAVK